MYKTCVRNKCTRRAIENRLERVYMERIQTYSVVIYCVIELTLVCSGQQRQRSYPWQSKYVHLDHRDWPLPWREKTSGCIPSLGQSSCRRCCMCKSGLYLDSRRKQLWEIRSLLEQIVQISFSIDRQWLLYLANLFLLSKQKKWSSSPIVPLSPPKRNHYFPSFFCRQPVISHGVDTGNLDY